MGLTLNTPHDLEEAKIWANKRLNPNRCIMMHSFVCVNLL